MEVSKARPTAIAKNLRKLIREMAHDNPTWGEERIAGELKLKLGIQVSLRGEVLDEKTSKRQRHRSALRFCTVVSRLIPLPGGRA